MGVPVRLDFTSNAASAKAGGEQTLAVVKSIREQVVKSNATIAESAKAAIRSSVAQRNELRDLAVEYRRTAAAAVKGSDEQVVAIKLARDAYVKLGTGASEAARVVQTAAAEKANAEKVAAGETVGVWRAAYAAIRAMATRTAVEQGAAAGAASKASRTSATERSVERGFLGAATKEAGFGRVLGGPAVVGAFVGVTALAESIKLTLRAQQSEAQLQNAMRNTGISYRANAKDINELLERQEKLSGFEKTDLRAAFTSLIQRTGDYGKSTRGLALATDLARGAHIDLGRSVTIVTRAIQGNVGQLARLGINIPKVTTHMDKLREAHIKVTNANRAQVIALTHQAAALDKQATSAAALEQLEQKYHGAALARSKTLSGALDTLRNRFREYAVEVGTKALPVVTKFFIEFNKGIDWIGKQKKAWAEIKGDIAGTFTAVAAVWKHVLEPVFAAIAKVIEHHKKLAAELAIALGLLFAPLIIAVPIAVGIVINHWKKISGFFTNLWADIRDHAEKFWDWMQLKALTILKSIVDPWSHLPSKAGQWARDLKRSLDTEMSKIKTDMAMIGADAGNAYGQAFAKTATLAIAGVATGTVVDPETAAKVAHATATGQGGVASAGAPPTSYKLRVAGQTAGLTALQGALPGAKGSNAISFPGHAAKSYHYSGEALDIGDGGNPASLISDWLFLYPHRANFAELIWNPQSTQVRAAIGNTQGGYFHGVAGGFSDHTDHIHVAFTGTPKQLQQILSSHPGGSTSSFDAAIAAAQANAPKPKPKPVPKVATYAGASVATVREDVRQFLAGINQELAKANLDMDPKEKALAAKLVHLRDELHKGMSPKDAANIRAQMKVVTDDMKTEVDKRVGIARTQAKAFAASLKSIRSFGRGILTAMSTSSQSDLTGTISSDVTELASLGQGPDRLATQLTAKIKKAYEQLATLKDTPTGRRLAQRIRAEIQDWGTALRDELGKQLTKAQEKQQEQQTRLDRWWRDLTTNMQRAFDAQTEAHDKAFDKATQAHLQKMQDDVTARIQTMTDATAAQIQSMTDATSASIQSMQDEFNQQLTTLQATVHSAYGDFTITPDGQTPAEAALQALQDAATSDDLQRALDDANDALKRSMLIGDPGQVTEAQRAVRDAQRAIDGARLQQQATDERKSADDALDAAKTQAQKTFDSQVQAYQRQQDAQVEAYQRQQDASVEAYQRQQDALQQSYQDERDATKTAYDTQRSDQWQHITDDLDDWNVWLTTKQKSYADFLTWYAKQNLGALPTDVDTPAAVFGGGSDFAAGYEGAPGNTVRRPGLQFATGAYLRSAVRATVGDVPEFVVPEAWVPPAMREQLHSILYNRGAPGSRAPMRQTLAGGEWGGAAGGPVIYAPLTINGSVAQERDIALTMRDHLVDVGRRTGGRMFAGQA